MNYQYLDSNNQPAGPASLEQIRALALEGKIAPDPMVCAEGTNVWTLLSAATGGGPAGRKLPFASTVLADFVGGLLKVVRGWLNPALVGRSLSAARDIGQYAVLAGGALCLIFSIVLAIRTNSFGTFLTGLGFVAALAVAQFAATRFLGAADTLIASTPSRLSSIAFLDCVGLLAVLAALGTLVVGFISAIQAETIVPLIPAFLLAVFWAFIGAIALHPELASVESGQGSAGEEAIGVIAFFLKAMLKTVPLFFALLALVGVFVLTVGLFAPNSNFAYQLSLMFSCLPIPSQGEAGFVGAGAVLAASLLPLVAYLWFLLASLPLEIWRSILALPGKLDALRR